MSGSVVLLNLAYSLLFSATFARRVVWLRSLLALGTFGFVAYGLAIDNPTMIVWNAMTGSLHSAQIARHLRARRAVVLTDDDLHWHRRFFPDLDVFDFFSLWSIASEEGLDSGSELTTEGERCDSVSLVLEGIVTIERGGDAIAERASGSLIGEMSFVTGEVATATARCEGPVRVRRWSHARLAALEELNPAAAKAFDRHLRLDLARKSV